MRVDSGDTTDVVKGPAKGATGTFTEDITSETAKGGFTGSGSVVYPDYTYTGTFKGAISKSGVIDERYSTSTGSVFAHAKLSGTTITGHYRAERDIVDFTASA